LPPDGATRRRGRSSSGAGARRALSRFLAMVATASFPQPAAPGNLGRNRSPRRSTSLSLPMSYRIRPPLLRRSAATDHRQPAPSWAGGMVQFPAANRQGRPAAAAAPESYQSICVGWCWRCTITAVVFGPDRLVSNSGIHSLEECHAGERQGMGQALAGHSEARRENLPEVRDTCAARQGAAGRASGPPHRRCVRWRDGRTRQSGHPLRFLPCRVARHRRGLLVHRMASQASAAYAAGFLGCR